MQRDTRDGEACQGPMAAQAPGVCEEKWEWMEERDPQEPQETNHGEDRDLREKKA